MFRIAAILVCVLATGCETAGQAQPTPASRYVADAALQPAAETASFEITGSVFLDANHAVVVGADLQFLLVFGKKCQQLNAAAALQFAGKGAAIVPGRSALQVYASSMVPKQCPIAALYGLSRKNLAELSALR